MSLHTSKLYSASFENKKSSAGWRRIALSLRREGDSNPRYSYPYGSLANCWFKPLTHLSSNEVNPLTRDKNRKTWINFKIRRDLFEPFKNVSNKFEVFKSLLIKILDGDLTRPDTA